MTAEVSPEVDVSIGATKKKKDRKGTITSTIRCEIKKPLDVTWDAFGTTLRALRAPLHRALNNAITDLEIAHRANDTTHPQTLAYRLVEKYWSQEREAAALRVAEGKKVYALDEDIAKEVPSGATKLGMANLVHTHWKKWHKERWKGKMSLPSFTRDSTICLSASGIHLVVEDGSYNIRLKLTTAPPYWLALLPCGGSSFAQMKQLLEGSTAPEDAPTGITFGDCRILQARDRASKKMKWYVMIAWTRPIATISGGRTMAVHRGVRNFLSAAVGRDGDRDAYTTILETGDDIVRHKQQYSARRKSLGRHGPQLGEGAKGHGVARRYERITQLEHQEENWVRSKVQEIAAHVMRLAQKKGVTRILIEDWSNPAKDGAPELGEYIEYYVRSFPLAQLKEAIIWAAKKAGIVCDQVTTICNGQRCPNCRTVTDQGKSTTFNCPECKLERNIDSIFAWNMLIDQGSPSPLEDHNKAIRRARKRILGEATAA